MRSSALLWLSLALWATAAAQLPQEPPTLRVGVLSLFHPQVLVLSADHPVTLLLDGEPFVLDANQKLTLHADAHSLSAEVSTATPTARTGIERLRLPATRFTLTVPGKLQRTYLGALHLSTHAHTLEPVIEMSTELAVASIVAAESPPHAPLEALKAQAVAARSFLLSNPHAHSGFDACDTTHCQFLRSPPADDAPAAVAARATRGMVVTWRSTPDAPPAIVAVMYARSCGGHTRTPDHVTEGAYPFYSVRCAFCTRHPELWLRAALPATATEQQRIAWNRTHGWQAMPSSNYTERSGQLVGRGSGHGIGLCQLGAADLARRGLLFPAILAQYLPDTSLATLR